MCSAATALEVRVEAKGEGLIWVHWDGQPSTTRTLYRTAAPIAKKNLWNPRYPVVRFDLPPEKASGYFVDDQLADGTTYYYWVAEGLEFSPRVWARTPSKSLPHFLSRPTFLLDKSNYYLELRDHGRRVKRYPLSLGKDPFGRKLHQDNATTPEGVYHIAALQEENQYYKAIDLDYPNEIDEIRFTVAEELGLLPTDNIGGSIQIHGDIKVDVEVFSNWTLGCIAFRNDDLDELFSRPEIRVGTTIFIVGKEMTRKDLVSALQARDSGEILQYESILEKLKCNPGLVDGYLDTQTRKALGRFQVKKGLPLTCELDVATVRHLRGYLGK